MEIWTRLIEGQNLKLRCRCFATFFCSDGVFVIFFRGVAVWTVPQCPPHYHTRNPLRNCNTFFPKKKTNLLCILTTSFNIARFEHENEMRRKALKQKKKLESSPFWNPESTGLESGIHSVESRIQDCHGFPHMGRLVISFPE